MPLHERAVLATASENAAVEVDKAVSGSLSNSVSGDEQEKSLGLKTHHDRLCASAICIDCVMKHSHFQVTRMPLPLCRFC